MATFQNIVAAKMAQSALTASAAVYYTCQPATQAYVKDIDVCNTSTTGVTVTIYLVPSGASTSSPSAAYALFYNAALPGSSTMQWTGSQILNSGDSIVAVASVANVVALKISGAEAT